MRLFSHQWRVVLSVSSAAMLLPYGASAQEQLQELPPIEAPAATQPTAPEPVVDNTAPQMLTLPEGAVVDVPEVLPEDAADEDFSDAVVSAGDANQAALPEQQGDDAIAQSNWEGSLMFLDENADSLLAIYRRYLMQQQTGGEEESGPTGPQVFDPNRILEGMTQSGDEPEQIQEEVLKFSLNSILYDSPQDWSMWINGQRYNKEQAEEGFSLDRSTLRVIDADRREITYLWTPISASFDYIQQHWNDKQRLGQLAVSSQVAKNERVEFNAEEKTVTITMRPNQTFVSQFMSVMEGVDTIRPTGGSSAIASAEGDMQGEEQPPQTQPIAPQANPGAMPESNRPAAFPPPPVVPAPSDDATMATPNRAPGAGY